MMHKKIHIFLLLLCASLNAQKVEKYQSFFNDYFANKNSQIIYSEHKFLDIEKIKNRILESNTIHKWEYADRFLDKIEIDSLNFSNDELKYVIEEIAKGNNKLWAKNVIIKSKYISRKNIEKIFTDKSKGWEYFNEKYGKEFYTFSKPIFLKQNSICFIYCGYGCGSLCGNGSFDIYIKQNGKWIIFNSLLVWVS